MEEPIRRTIRELHQLFRDPRQRIGKITLDA